MIFGKKKGMIDVGRMHQRGAIVVPKEDLHLPTDKDGFVTFEDAAKPQRTSPQRASLPLSFLKESATTRNHIPEGVTGMSPSNARVEAKLIDLDNQIYQLTQRIEQLEQKLNGTVSSTSSTPSINW